MKNQIIITCSEDGAYLVLKYDKSGIGLTKGENVLTVAEIPELAYGFTTYDYKNGEECGEYIESIDLSDYDTSKVRDMSYMFARCYNLKSLDINIDTSNVTNMFGMFENCHLLEEIHFHQFDTSKVDNMGNMFEGCESLKHLDVSHFNTSNVSYMGWMFAECSSLETLDLSNFNTENVKDMSSMFSGCKSLINLDISSFDFSKTMRKKNMFEGCKEGIGINLNKIKFNPEMMIDDDMKRNGMKYKVGSDYCYETDSIFGTIVAKGIVVYNNGIVAIARVWYGNFEMISSLEADDYTYTEERIAKLFNDFTDNHIRFQCEEYLLIDLKTNALVPRGLSYLYIMD